MLAGLGNPGGKYLLTPHNIGWMLVDTLAQHYNVQLRSKGSYTAEVAHVWEPSSMAHSKLQIREKKTYMSDSTQIQNQKVILNEANDLYEPIGQGCQGSSFLLSSFYRSIHRST